MAIRGQCGSRPAFASAQSGMKAYLNRVHMSYQWTVKLSGQSTWMRGLIVSYIVRMCKIKYVLVTDDTSHEMTLMLSNMKLLINFNYKYVVTVIY